MTRKQKLDAAFASLVILGLPFVLFGAVIMLVYLLGMVGAHMTEALWEKLVNADFSDDLPPLEENEYYQEWKRDLQEYEDRLYEANMEAELLADDLTDIMRD